MIQVELVAFHGVEQEIEALLPSRPWVGRRYALHGGDAAEEGGFPVKSRRSVKIGESRVTGDLLLVRQLPGDNRTSLI